MKKVACDVEYETFFLCKNLINFLSQFIFGVSDVSTCVFTRVSDYKDANDSDVIIHRNFI